MINWIRKHVVLASAIAGLGLYAVSAVGHSIPTVAAIAVACAGACGLILGWKSPRWASAAIALELVVGSFGRLASADVLGYDPSLRQALFVGAMLGWSFSQLADRRRIEWFPQPFRGPMQLLWFAAIIGVLVGVGGSNAFHDFNGYIYLLAAPLVFATVRAGDWALYGRILAGGVIALSVATIATLVVFGWIPREQLDGLYTWVRDVRLGEITPVAGTYYRVFMQSQVYALVLALGGAAAYLWTSSPWSRRAALTASAAGLITVVASLSRSFWVAGIVGAAVLAWILLKTGRSLRQIIAYCAIGVGAAVVAFYGLQLATGNFPLSLQQRLDVNEPAAAARSAQAGPLWSAVKSHPILGNGFGTTVTYRAVDPRRASESAEVTTDTFELGWLDTWLDIGMVGVLALLWWLRRLWKSGLAVSRQSAIGVITVLAVTMLAVVHIFTPYLNHPLGLSLLLFLSALQPRLDKSQL